MLSWHIDGFQERSWRGRLALVAVGAVVATGSLHPFAVSMDRIALAFYHAHESPSDGRRRVLGAPYTQSVETIRQALPLDQPYALAEGGDPLTGSALWLRYDLAPRKAVDLGELEALAAHPKRIARIPPEVRWVVVTDRQRAQPELYSRADFLAFLRRRMHAP